MSYISYMQMPFAPLEQIPTMSNDATHVTTDIVQPIPYQNKAVVQAAQKLGMTVEQYLKMQENVAKSNKAVISDGHKGRRPGDSKKATDDLIEMQKANEAAAKQKALKTVEGFLEMTMPSTYIGLGTGAIFPDDEHHELFEKTRLPLDLALTVGGGALVKSIGKKAVAEATPVVKKSITAPKVEIRGELPAASKIQSEQLASVFSKSDLNKDIEDNIEHAKMISDINGYELFHPSKMYISLKDTHDPHASEYLVGYLDPTGFEKYYGVEEIPRRLRELGYNPDEKIILAVEDQPDRLVIESELLKEAVESPAEIFYSDALSPRIAGYHSSNNGKDITRVRLIDKWHNLPEIKSTAFHERTMHGTDWIVNDISRGKVEDMYKEISSKVIPYNDSASNNWVELRATLGEINRKLYINAYKEHPQASWDELRQIVEKSVDNMTPESLQRLLFTTNGYGADYSLTLGLHKELFPKFIDLLKKAPAIAAPVAGAGLAGTTLKEGVSIPDGQEYRHGGLLNYLNYIK